MLSLAAWSMKHRRTVVAVWLVALVGSGGGLSGGLGNHFVNDFSLPGTGSQHATDLLQSRFPAQAGDTDQIVFHARIGSLDDPPVKARIEAMLAKVSRLQHVTGVSSPYSPGMPRIARYGAIGFATVSFDQRSTTLSTTATKRVIRTAQAISSPGLEVELGGPAIEQTETATLGAATAIGIGAAIVVLLLSFGSLLAMVLPVVTALFGLGTSAGLIAVLTHVMNTPSFSSELAVLVGLGVGIDYSLFVVTRFREAYHANGGAVEGAVAVAMDTAGRSIAFAGTAVVIAMFGLFAAGVALLYPVAIAISMTVLVVLLAALTLLPALLSRTGARIGAPRRSRTQRGDGAGGWARWVGLVQRRPVLSALAATALMLVLAAPALGLRLAASDASNDLPSTTTRKAYDLLAQGYGRGFNGPLIVAAQVPRGDAPTTLSELSAATGRTPGVASVARQRLNPAGDTAAITLYPRAAPESSQTYKLVTDLRDRVIAPIERATGASVYVGGWTATQVDFAHIISRKLPVFIGVVIAVSALLLLLVFRSLVIPIQAAVMNLLSIAAALGVAQAIFERGWLAGLLGVQQAPIDAYIPVIVFAIVFGLSMDYEVFLISRVHEDWRRTGDHPAAVKHGLTSSGRVITAAAAVMIVVFASFVASNDQLLKLFGLSLASAVLLDALVIRTLLLPAVLQLLGPRAWAFPRWLGRRLPVLAVEPTAPNLPNVSEPVSSHAR
jgi:RND superfamily putative drug exporter